ncbi:serine hydrolase domain-containing protein [Paenibacillus sp. 481]|uniref:serine hydrolase domain-containing protein n=1 Tax=Paenibacillus sp. 481 TaxID=2835869 RepID=UPI001E434FB3|nr:serine hydrolase domain-containing protein [Paenibacillus sp. 481]UHA73387.1 beta-lactamase family protein [Paenibacillus sp. 481]
MLKQAWSQERLARLRTAIASHVERGALPGVVYAVSRRGETYVEAIGTMDVASDRPITRDAIFRMASLTKPVTAVAALILAEQGRLTLDEPIDRWLPELSERKVLRHPDGPLDDTVPAQRPITTRDLLTLKTGIGLVLKPPGSTPIQRAMEEAGIAPGPNLPLLPPDEWMKRLGSLPLIHHPGEEWMYDTGIDILGILIARASAQSLATFMHEHIFEPLRMKDTAFAVSAEQLHRLPASYETDWATGGLAIHDEPTSSRWLAPSVFSSGSSGLVSTVDDYLAFYNMLLNKGTFEGGRILSRSAVEMLGSSHLTPSQRLNNRLLLDDGGSWGMGVGVTVERTRWFEAGIFGWSGGTGTSAYIDPKNEWIGILLTQRMMDSAEPSPIFQEFWTAVNQAIND